jgi:hypothetical protein
LRVPVRHSQRIFFLREPACPGLTPGGASDAPRDGLTRGGRWWRFCSRARSPSPTPGRRSGPSVETTIMLRWVVRVNAQVGTWCTQDGRGLGPSHPPSRTPTGLAPVSSGDSPIGHTYHDGESFPTITIHYNAPGCSVVAIRMWVHLRQGLQGFHASSDPEVRLVNHFGSQFQSLGAESSDLGVMFLISRQGKVLVESSLTRRGLRHTVVG